MWVDANNDGTLDGETGLNGVTVVLFSGATPVATTTTAGNGNYLFTDLIPGTYTVQITPPCRVRVQHRHQRPRPGRTSQPPGSGSPTRPTAPTTAPRRPPPPAPAAPSPSPRPVPTRTPQATPT
ncbi:hypothetical protein FRUB_09519 [Fimbriiglobus ruber]|uniref:SD-repeat containing protein B domain-containing protein n=1 Tax=Fimbriiglobus ruber TaxID=1908690 RepID=A0A225DEZ6_9BACT|nr:hypothetical protein FRUB_09519 [Fimbriiglobus ruber]